MRKFISTLDDILKLFAASYIFLSIAGFVDLKTFYAEFGISINEYLTVSEIIFSSLDKLALVIFALLCQFVTWSYFFKEVFDYNLEESLADGERRPRKYHDETSHRLIKNKKFIWFWLIVIFANFILAIFSSIFPGYRIIIAIRDFLMINYWMSICLYVAWLQGTFKLYESFKKQDDFNAKTVVILIVFVSTLLTSIWIKNLFLFNRITLRGNNHTVELFFVDSTIKQTDSVRFIGKTEKYFFFWDKFKRQAFCYPVSEVKKIVFK